MNDSQEALIDALSNEFGDEGKKVATELIGYEQKYPYNAVLVSRAAAQEYPVKTMEYAEWLLGLLKRVKGSLGGSFPRHSVDAHSAYVEGNIQLPDVSAIPGNEIDPYAADCLVMAVGSGDNKIVELVYGAIKRVCELGYRESESAKPADTTEIESYISYLITTIASAFPGELFEDYRALESICNRIINHDGTLEELYRDIYDLRRKSQDLYTDL